MQQVDTDPPSLPVGTEVSAKYKGAFCEAKVSKVVRNIKVKVAYKQGLGSGIVSDDLIKVAPGQLRVGAPVEVRHPDRKDLVEGTVTKIQDCSQYTVVFDDGDITTLRRTALCLKSGRHFNESETLDQLPLTHPEHFGNPVVGGRRGRRRGQLNDDSSDEEDESDTKEVVNEKEEHIGKVVCVEMETKKKDKEKWFPGLVLAPLAQANVRIRVKDEYLVRSFKDGRYYTVPKKEATDFTREVAAKQDGQPVQAALEYLDSGALPPHWDRESLFGLNNSSSEGEGEVESDSSDDEPREEKDRFVAQLYKYMDDRGTPLNKVPSIQNRDVDLYRLFRAVQKCGGYNRVTAKNQWKSIAIRLGFTPVTVSVTNLVKQAFKKFLQPYGEFHRKLGCSMLMTPRNASRSKGRSLVRANSVASPKPVEVSKETLSKSINITTTTSSSSSASSVSSSQNITATVAPITTPALVSAATPSVTEESENTSESSLDNTKNKRKILIGKVKGLVEKYEEKAKDDSDVPLVPLSKIKTAAESIRSEEKEKDTSLKDSAPVASSQLRESSPPGTSAANKKDKNQKKLTPQSDDKRIKRKKDDTIEKVDAGDFIVEVGDKLKVYYHEKKVTYEAKVIEITVQRGLPMYLVHYTGWNNRYDEWVPRERIAENITKGSKQKGRLSNLSSSEKQKENPSKPPPASSLTSSGSPNSITNAMSSTPGSTKMSASAKRGRGRSDSLPPRSTTPSSVASNSSRTKSPATAGPKQRPIRSMANTARRTSANISDVSLQSDSETDSDEPVRRPTRGTKETEYKSGNLSGKLTSKNKLSVSAGNSQSDTDDDDDEGESSTISRANNSSTNNLHSKGRNYDLSQIRSELRGFQGLKSPSSSLAGDDEILSDIKAEEASNKDESIFEAKDTDISESKPAAESNTRVETVKNEPKQDLKEENLKSSTDMSSETESFCDDDSQSSGKTTTLENMTKKFQQKIKAGKQQSLEKLSCGKPAVERVPRVVEKIIQDSLAEKLQESLKTKPDVKQEEGSERSISDTVICKSEIVKKDDGKNNPIQTTETLQKGTSSNQARFGGTMNTSKFASVIIEKPVSSGKKTEFGSSKKPDLIRKGITDNIESKKVIEPLLKETNKCEPSAACSPSSSSSSSSSSTSTSSRSLPDMSKLDISGGSSTSSSYTISNRESKLLTVTPKATSPDIYEFKDPEPFEFEMRKLPTASTNASSLTSSVISASSVSASPRKQSQKIGVQQAAVNEKQQPSQSPIAALVNRKKRGSPMKDAAVEKSKLLKAEEKTAVISEGKLLQVSSTISSVTKGNIGGQTKLLPPNPLTSNQSSSVSQKSVDTAHNTSFDALRKSPNFNVNINALNEELAQTVQETTRALTDAFQTPSVAALQEVTGTATKLEPSKEKDIGAILATPPRRSAQSNTPAVGCSVAAVPSKPVIGSPFVETRKDVSNVFELSTSEGLTSISELKDNKFEFENAKKMLATTSSAFDLDPSKYENKPTSIADKLLKAISQKKEEDKHRVEPKSEKGEEGVGGALRDATTAITKNLPGGLPAINNATIEPLNINTDLAGSSMSYLSGSSSLDLENMPLMSGSINKSLSLTSPEPKLGILESITVKNNDLTETIQKLECAIQRKTPVTGLSVTTTPTSSLAPNTFSEDSMDSTDSERRLVIEDVAEDICDMLKSPTGSQHMGELKPLQVGVLPQKFDIAATKLLSSNIVPHAAVQAPIPLKVVQSSRPQAFNISASIPAATQTLSVTTTTKAPEMLPAASALTISQNGLQVVPITITEQGNTKFTKQDVQKDHKPLKEGTSSSSAENIAEIGSTYSEYSMGSRDDFSVKLLQTAELSPTTGAVTILMASSNISKQPIQRVADVVPIELPDIPVSVVVASGAVPSVKAAAQAAAAAAAQNSTSCKLTLQTDLKVAVIASKVAPTSIVSAPSAAAFATEKGHEVQMVQNTGVNANASAVVTNLTPPAAVAFPQLAGMSSNSGFYLDARTELRPEDGVKPIAEIQRSNSEIECLNAKSVGGVLCSDELASSLSVDANNDSINLLCEETIPGSPAPAFGGKEESLTTQQITESNMLLESDSKDLGNNSRAVALIGNVNSSPNDSASQDESSEDLKKNLDLENEISPRKRRRTRKQSEMTIISEQQTKRRKPMGCPKKIPAGSDSDENSDGTSQRSTVLSRHQFQQQQLQLQHRQTSVGTRPCPYNFLVQLDPNMSSDQCIAILMKQIQELRKTYNTIKGDLANIDRRRKKLRRREREKKQQVQSQQQIKIA